MPRRRSRAASSSDEPSDFASRNNVRVSDESWRHHDAASSVSNRGDGDSGIRWMKAPMRPHDSPIVRSDPLGLVGRIERGDEDVGFESAFAAGANDRDAMAVPAADVSSDARRDSPPVVGQTRLCSWAPVQRCAPRSGRSRTVSV